MAECATKAVQEQLTPKCYMLAGGAGVHWGAAEQSGVRDEEVRGAAHRDALKCSRPVSGWGEGGGGGLRGNKHGCIGIQQSSLGIGQW